MGGARQFLHRNIRRQRGGIGRLDGIVLYVATGLVAGRCGLGVRRRCGRGAELGQNGRPGRVVIALRALVALNS